MSWKAIGQSVTGTSHTAVEKGCEDAIRYTIINDISDEEVLICCASDGAGSAQYAAWASAYVTEQMVDCLCEAIHTGTEITEAVIYGMAERLYAGLSAEANAKQVPLNEFSCTLLGCCLLKDSAAFFHIGDGAIVRNDGQDYYTPVWWPHNGEYQNATTFLIDDPTLKDLHITILYERVDEVALFTDGLQMLALNMEGCHVHQPFFTDLFRFLRIADEQGKVSVLGRKLEEYLDSRQINERTDDDKTLFLATRLIV